MTDLRFIIAFQLSILPLPKKVQNQHKWVVTRIAGRKNVPFNEDVADKNATTSTGGK